ncbi:MAG: Bifunctional glutathionylspermidine synthetase/amidase [Candidatus Dichloromethanomonas elyunquensis]|nr:MAG: Bifunctional glutathionylspermidine synthetase/amidase [Candidatus Dichloromethanomonas elyunquensis]
MRYWFDENGKNTEHDPVLKKVKYWTVKGHKNQIRKRTDGTTPLSAGILLIVLALMIVTGYNAAFGREQIVPSYGSQQSVTSQGSEIQTQIRAIRQSEYAAGTKIDEYKGVAVFSNGLNYMSSHGLSYSEDGYYYGYKWQCVEFVKRFYYEKYKLHMPDGAGNAKYFFNPQVGQGQLNEQRGLVQYLNGGDVKPREDDLLVFTDGAYGHVALISEVGKDWIEVVQQNSEVTREKYMLQYKAGKYYILGERKPAGWLRIP